MATEEAGASRPSSTLAVAAAWLAVAVPLLWGVAQTLKKAFALFG